MYRVQYVLCIIIIIIIILLFFFLFTYKETLQRKLFTYLKKKGMHM